MLMPWIHNGFTGAGASGVRERRRKYHTTSILYRGAFVRANTPRTGTYRRRGALSRIRRRSHFRGPTSMAPRANWKGYLRLSLVSCPIALYPATTESEKIRFHQIHAKTGNRIRYKKVDEET